MRVRLARAILLCRDNFCHRISTYDRAGDTVMRHHKRRKKKLARK